MQRFAVVSRLGGKLVAAGACALVLAACSGSVNTLGSLGGSSGEGQGDKGINAGPSLGGTKQELCTKPTVSASPMRRLTHHEYGNAVRDLLGPSAKLPALTADTQPELFDTMADQSLSSLLADEYVNAAGDLADGIADINAVVGCAPGKASEACVRDFIARFGRRAFRRPLTGEESTRLSTLYESARTAADTSTAVRAVVAAVLASPHFLFRPEWGGEKTKLANALTVAPYEMATRLSFLLWSSVPDDVLLDAAEDGELETPAQLTAQAERMLKDPRGRSANYNFYKQWFGLSLLDTATKNPDVYPNFDD
ncbi:MAG: DUF1592 domain-containing protein, partial [Polyangiales bacterium]